MVYFANDSGNRPIWRPTGPCRHTRRTKVVDVHVGLSEDQWVIDDYNRFRWVRSQFREKLAALGK